MLVLLGFGMISTFMLLIMSKRLTPVAALIVVPLLFGLLSGRGAELAPPSWPRSRPWRPQPACCSSRSSSSA